MTTTSIPPTDRLSANAQVVQAFITELFSEGRLDAVDRYLDPDFVNHDPPFPGAPGGPDGMRQAAVLFRTACPDWHSDLEALLTDGDVVVERFTARGTHRGELLGAPATGKTLELRGINIFRVADGRIVERWGRTDDLGLARQLGLVG